jgi:capsular polysaccharide biosynthesis protein
VELLLIKRMLLRRWWLILLPAIVVAALTLPALLTASGSAGFSAEIRYSAMQRFDAVPRQEGDYQDIWRSAELTIDAFTDWVRSGSFREETAQRAAELSAPVSADSIGIAADNAASLGQIIISHSDAAALEIIQQAAIDVLQTRSAAYFPQLGGMPAEVAVLQRGGITPVPAPIGDRLAPLVRIGLGLLAGIALAVGAEYLDRTIRYRDELERLGLTVIASIPRR